MAERRDADVLKIIVGQPAHHLAVDVVGAEQIGILGETDPAEPTIDVQVQSPRLLSAADLKRVDSSAPAVIPRGFSNQPWICHADPDYSTAAYPPRQPIPDRSDRRRMTRDRIALPKPCAR